MLLALLITRQLWLVLIGSFYCTSLFCWLRSYAPFLSISCYCSLVAGCFPPVADQVFSDLQAEKRDGKRDALISSVNPKLG